ncbi:MAG TPA: branched-chain amino acid ABC transporter permease [bacterium]|nr:branched-chain amino acid ABC transporter permease [Candidatus Omnitrophota bacterium]HOJ62606.1 branched-chain amino acid ABC transporter permease [bacterium]HOL94431.1 branched-chain amino acid ABC transporter permease [bacterium]
MGRQNRTALVFLILLMAIGPWVIGTHSYWINVFVFAGLHALIAIGLSLLMGYAGQISLGHGGFFGLGAYISGLLATLLHWNPWFSLLAALALTALAALLIGIPSLRLRGHYLAMATLAFGEIVVITFNAEVNLTGGPSGFGQIPRLSLGGLSLKDDLVFYYFVWSLVILVLAGSLNLIHSRVGRALRSIHGGETAANAMGINTAAYKVQVFVLSAVLAALAGGLYAHYVTFVSPTICEIKFSVILVVMVAVGGMTSVWGALLGAIGLTILPEFLTVFEDMDILVYGMILMLIMIFAPGGLFGWIVNGSGWIRRRTAGRVRTG